MKFSRRLLLIGISLLLTGALIFGLAHVYLRIAPKKYAASALVRISSTGANEDTSGHDVMLEFTKMNPDLKMEMRPANSLARIIAHAETPEAAASRANQGTREMQRYLETRMGAKMEVVTLALPAQHAAEPNRRSILMGGGIVSLNFAAAGILLTLAAFRHRAVADLQTPS